MGKTLEAVVERLRVLPEEQQEALASILLQEIEAEVGWDERFARSPDLLASLAEQARCEVAMSFRVGPRTRPR
jgi:hypothetical protein